MLKIIITGAESSGKTTLAIQLSKYLRLSLIVEQARVFLDANGPLYAYDDIKKMAFMHYEIESEMDKFGRSFICDTDLVNYEVWYSYKYGKQESFLYDLKKKLKRPDLYLLLAPNPEWTYDPLREHKQERWEIFEEHKKVLDRENQNYVVITGEPFTRLNKAINEILKLYNPLSAK